MKAIEINGESLSRAVSLVGTMSEARTPRRDYQLCRLAIRGDKISIGCESALGMCRTIIEGTTPEGQEPLVAPENGPNFMCYVDWQRLSATCQTLKSVTVGLEIAENALSLSYGKGEISLLTENAEFTQRSPINMQPALSLGLVEDIDFLCKTSRKPDFDCATLMKSRVGATDDSVMGVIEGSQFQTLNCPDKISLRTLKLMAEIIRKTGEKEIKFGYDSGLIHISWTSGAAIFRCQDTVGAKVVPESFFQRFSLHEIAVFRPGSAKIALGLCSVLSLEENRRCEITMKDGIATISKSTREKGRLRADLEAEVHGEHKWLIDPENVSLAIKAIGEDKDISVSTVSAVGSSEIDEYSPMVFSCGNRSVWAMPLQETT